MLPAIGQEGDRKPVRQQTVRHLGQFKGLVVAVGHRREHAAPRPVQRSAPILDRHHPVGGVLILPGVGRERVRRPRVGVAGFLPRLLVGAHLRNRVLALLAKPRAPIDRLAAAQPVDQVPGQRPRHFARAAIGQDGDADAEVGHQRHQRAPAGPAAPVQDQPVAAIARALEAEPVVRLAELGEARHRVVNARRMQLADQRGRQQALAVDLAPAQMQSHPACQVRNRGVDRPAGQGPDRQADCRQARVLVHHVGPRRVRGSLEVLEREADRHAERIGQPRADEGLVTLSAQALDDEAGNVVAEVVVLPGRAQIAARVQVPHRAHELGRRAIARHMHPVVPRQSGLMAQQVAHRHPLARHRILQTELRQVLAHRLGPVDAPLALQQRHGRRGERLGDRADQELRRGGNRQVPFHITHPIRLCQHHLAVLHHRQRRPRHLPVVHGVGRKPIELGHELRDRHKVGVSSHARDSQTD